MCFIQEFIEIHYVLSTNQGAGAFSSEQNRLTSLPLKSLHLYRRSGEQLFETSAYASVHPYTQRYLLANDFIPGSGRKNTKNKTKQKNNQKNKTITRKLLQKNKHFTTEQAALRELWTKD